MGIISTIRKTFAGVNDTYMPPVSFDLIDVTGTFFTQYQKDTAQQRLKRYKTFWNYYNSEPYNQELDEGRKKFFVNMCRPIVNKSVDWLFGHGIKFDPPPGNENVVALLDMVWKANKKDFLLWEHGQIGAVSGDAYFYLTVPDTDSDGNPIPLDQRIITITNLDSCYVFPVYDVDPFEMESCLIQQPRVFSSDPLQPSNSAKLTGIHSILIDKNTIREFWNNSEIENRKRVNVLGFIPVAHTRNLINGKSVFGFSDITDIISLSDSLNRIGNDIDNILEYHAAPTTLIFGARAQQLEKGPNKLWSGLPKDARVENLRLEGNLDAAVQHYNTTKLAIHEISNTPENSLGTLQEISNTSGVALEIQFMPLVEKTKRKYLSYGLSIAKVNEMILRISERLLGIDVNALVKDQTQKYTVNVKFNSPFPSDEKAKVDLLLAKLNGKIESRAGALRELGEVDLSRKMLEIVADQRETMAEDVERAVASSGARDLNMNVFALGSYALNTPEIQEAIKEHTEADQESSVSEPDKEMQNGGVE